MIWPGPFFFAAFFIVALPLLRSAPAGAAQPSPAGLEKYVCVSCHEGLKPDPAEKVPDPDMVRLSAPVEDWKASAHFEAGVMCADCHGGNPKDEGLAMDAAEGYIGKPKTSDIPKLCAKCHSDAKMMRAFNQRADQFDLYSGSIHGRKMAEGDMEAPTCISCHGKHKILKVKDVNALVNRRNIPQTCGECHAKKNIFARRGKPFNELDMYKKSRHYEKFSQGDVLAPNCKDCHGNHDITPAKSERTQTVCFGCHAVQAENYKASAHWAAFKKGGEPVCLHCHKNHDVSRPTEAKFDGKGPVDCSACHDDASPAYKMGLDIQSMVKSTTNAVQTAALELEDYKAHAHGGFEISDIEDRLGKAKARLADLRALTHKMERDPLRKESEAVISQAQGVSEDIHRIMSEIRTRKIGLAGAWFVFAGLMYSMWAKARTYERKE
jgi:hypothetical protein